MVTSLQQAILALEQDESIWLLLTEARINGYEVADFLAALKSIHPAIVSMAVTSIQDASLVIKLINSGQVLRFLGKPLDAERLLMAGRLAESRYSALRSSRALQSRFQVDTPESIMQLLTKLRSTPLASHVSAIPNNASKAGTASTPATEPARLGLMQQLFAFFKAR